MLLIIVPNASSWQWWGRIFFTSAAFSPAGDAVEKLGKNENSGNNAARQRNALLSVGKP
ncbi:hypothetical protein [Roseiconus lacunae]|uniref:hypothetical protein n=1 Tax=Roseiconus lacunae TaxID=2605694 RepID=UPI0013DD7939